jgi:hypothetical protein
MPTPAYTRNMRKWSGVYFGDTRGRAIPHNKRRACLCADADMYSTECCEGALIGQSIGPVSGAPRDRGAFSAGFSSGFEIGTTE